MKKKQKEVLTRLTACAASAGLILQMGSAGILAARPAADPGDGSVEAACNPGLTKALRGADRYEG